MKLRFHEVRGKQLNNNTLTKPQLLALKEVTVIDLVQDFCKCGFLMVMFLCLKNGKRQMDIQ